MGFPERLENRLQLSATMFVDGWSPIDAVPRPDANQTSYLRTDNFAPYRLDTEHLASLLALAPGEDSNEPGIEVQLPRPDGSFAKFTLVDSPIMAPELAAQFPEIRTYAGQGIDDPAATVRIDISPAGFHAQVLSPTGTYYVDPYFHLDTEYYASYFRSTMVSMDDQPHDHNEGDVESHSPLDLKSTGDVEFRAPVAGTSDNAKLSPTVASRSGTELRTYRTAVAATGEYVAFHGGTVALGQAAIVTAINRVSAIYESELSIRLQLVANNNLLVYTNGATDPYSNSNPSALLNENQANTDTTIGSGNYDIGHVFTTGGGGLAGLGVVGINGEKARGETGLGTPIGDAFYVDYVAHEMGHQFGGNHTFNGVNGATSGNQNSSTAYEPGSGSTIQAYAGISGADDLQTNSDPYFHSISFDEIITHVDTVIPTVGTRTATGNNVPTVNAGSNYTIPAQTPFTLTAEGNDADVNDVLTYSWEQRDLGPFQAVSAPDNGSSPLFRVFNPTEDPSRTFPRLSDLLNNTTVVGERLPTLSRTMNFRVTVRDNRSGGGGVNTDDMQVNVINTGSAFTVTSPNTAVSLAALSSQTITWNVAGTTANGIDTPNVNILLSTDGGMTFPISLASTVPNDGSETLVLPDITTTQARIKVEGAGNVFFDLSNVNFTITAPLNPYDFGDAPTATLLANNGPRHLIGGPSLGLGIPDGEPDGLPNSSANGDGVDENGIRNLEPFVAGATAQLQVTSTAGGGELNYFFDFDGNGVFGNNPNEIFQATLTGGIETIPVAIPSGVTGTVFGRFRISTAGGLTALGEALDGEVEDYRFDVFATAPPLDFGDAADGTYPTSEANNGARHSAVGPILGTTRDAENDGLSSTTATGDGVDEDGVLFPEILQVGNNASISVTSSLGGGILNAFFDWNQNGVWGDLANEVLTATLLGGTQLVTVPVPAGATPGTTYARFRISTGGSLSADGFAMDGEVEDYQIYVIDPFASTLFQNFDTVTAPGLPTGWTTQSTGTSPQNWRTVSGVLSDSPPNHAFVPGPDPAMNSHLQSPTFVATHPRLKFRHSYNTELNYDGGVLEIRIGTSSTFVDIITAGGSFVTGGYSATINNFASSTLVNRAAWTGNSSGYIETIVNLPSSALNQNVQFRWRFASDSSIASPNGWRIDNIEFTDNGTYDFDFGDAPDPSFATLSTNSGAAHAQGYTTVALGAGADFENNGAQSANATGDDAVGDDEDGITWPAAIVQGEAFDINVNASADGLLSAWIDYNDDGDWADPGEQIARDYVVLAGDNVLNVQVPVTATITAQTFARFRISTNAGQGPSGRAPDGEVEDYAIAIEQGMIAVNLAVTETTGAESSGTAITVTATTTSAVIGAQTLTIDVSGLGIDNNDYDLSNPTITIPDGGTTGSVTFTIFDDAAIEGLETAILTITNLSSGLALGTTVTQNVEIVDDDGTVSISRTGDGFEALTPTAGRFRVTQSVSNPADTIVTYTLAGSASGGVDYVALTGTATIPGGNTFVDIDVMVLDDLIVEGTETVTIQLTGFAARDTDIVLDTTPANLIANLEISESDAATFSISDASVLESSNILTFTLSTTMVLNVDVQVQVNFASNTATGENIDFDDASQIITFAAGTTDISFDVQILDDDIVEANELFNVSVTTSTDLGTRNVNLDDTATGTITDDDSATVSVVWVTDGIETNAPTNGQFQVIQTQESSTETVVTYQVMGTATAGTGNDYVTLSGTVIIPAGELTANIDVQVLNDAVVEPGETVIVTLNGFTNHDPQVTLDSTTANLAATVNISDEDSATVSINVVSDGVDASIPTHGLFQVILSNPSSVETEVFYEVSGSADAGTGLDYNSLSGSVIIPAGQTTADIVVEVLYDAFLEGTEDVTLSVTGLGVHAPQITLDPNSAKLNATLDIIEGQTNVISITSVQVLEGDSDHSEVILTVTSPISVPGGFTLDFSILDSIVNTTDYTLLTTSPLVFLGTANETQTITLQILGDDEVEADEVLIVTLGTVTPQPPIAAANFETTATGTVTIENDDDSILTITDSTVAEGDDGVTQITFTITSPGIVPGGFSVNFGVNHITTTNSDLVLSTSSPLIFSGDANESHTVTINVNSDLIVELDETFHLTLGSVTTSSSGAEASIVTGAEGLGTIRNDDQAIFTINDVSANEGDDIVTFNLSTDRPFDIDVVVTVTFTDSTAIGGDIDYIGTTQHITFQAGQTTQVVQVDLTNDSVVEATETFDVTISTATILGTRVANLNDIATGTIRDDDAASFRIDNVIVNEADETLTLLITTSNPLDMDTVVELTFTDQTASKLADYHGESQTVTILAGMTSTQVSVPILNDQINELTEVFQISFTSTSDFADREVNVDGTSTGTILDDDAALFAVKNVAVNEETQSLVFDLTTTVAFDVEITLIATFTSQSATGNGTDYVSQTQSVTFQVGQKNQTITVPLVNDAIVEADETFTIGLTTENVLTGRTIDLSRTAIGTILDTDAATVSISRISDGAESASPTNGRFRVSQTAVSSTDTVVNYSVTGLATSDVDYSVMTGTVIIPAGQTSVEFEVVVKDDVVSEPTETVIATLTGFGNHDPQISLAPSSLSATVNIIDNDSSILTVTNVSIAEGDVGNRTMTFNVTSSLAVQGGFSVAFAVSNITASTSDYTLLTTSPLLFAGTPKEVQTITISIVGDLVVEGNEQFTIALGNVTPQGSLPPSTVVSGAIATGTITNDDASTLSISNSTVTETDGSATQLTFTVTSPAAVEGGFTVAFNVSDITTAANDYVLNTLSPLVFLGTPNESHTISINVTGDNLAERNEELRVTLGTVAQAPISTGVVSGAVATGSIINDDTAMFTINDVSVTEGGGPVTISITTDTPLDVDVTISVTFNDGTAFGSGVDFTGSLTLIKFVAGETAHSVTLDVTNDQVLEATESMSAVLALTSSTDGRSVTASDTATVTILDNDSAKVSIAKIANIEESAAPLNGVFRVTMTNASATDTVVTYGISGTATPGIGNDYTTLNGTVTIPAGQKSANIVVPITADTTIEGNESIIASLTGFSSGDADIQLDTIPANLLDTLFILDDDQLTLQSPSTRTVEENTSPSTVLINASTLPAVVVGHTITFSLSGPDAAFFKIDSLTGEVTFLAAPDFDAPVDSNSDNVFQITIIAMVDVVPSTSVSQDVTVTVTGVNDNAPVFANASPTYSVAENSLEGTIVGGVSASDMDLLPQTVNYQIVSGNDSGAFALDPVTGQITIADSSILNFESTTSFALTIRARDSGIPGNSAEAVVVIQVSNVFEGPSIAILTPPAISSRGKTEIAIAPETTFVFSDSRNPSFEGSTLTVSILSGRGKKDRLSILKKGDPTDQIFTKGRKLVFGNGQLIGTYAGGRKKLPNLVVQLTSGATAATIEALIRRVSFRTTDSSTMPRVVQFQLTNVEGFDSNIATQTVTFE